MLEKEITLERENLKDQVITLDQEKAPEQEITISVESAGLREAYEKGVEDGESIGYGEGYAEGEETGYNNGLAEGENIGYEKGLTDGETAGLETGKQAEYNKMWDIIQDYGKAQNYHYAFASGRFTDKNFNPKYPIKCSDGTTPARYVFYNAPITDTKVEIVTNNNNANYMFSGASKTVNIRKFTVYETTELTGTFSGCSALTEIRIGGTIGPNISFAACSKLTHDSLISIINALKDYSGTTTTRTLTLHATAKKKLTETDIAIATEKGWTLA